MEQKQEESAQPDQTSAMSPVEILDVAASDKAPPVLIRKECPPWVRKVVALRKEYQEDTDLLCTQQVLINNTGLEWSSDGLEFISVVATDSDENIVFAFDEESGHLTEVSVEHNQLP